MKKILIVTPVPHDSTSLYRAFGVFQNLKKHADIELVNLAGNPSVTWVDLIQADILFMHRPFQPAQLSLAQYCRKLGKPLWVDFDDDLLHVPDHMTFAPIYQNPENINALVECTKMADVVTVTTTGLRDVYSKINPNVQIIPNALNDDLFGKMRETIPENDEKIVGWRGSETHFMDLMVHADAINAAIQSTRGQKKATIINIRSGKNMVKPWEWVFMGFRPFFINGIKHVPVSDPMPYFENIRRINPKIMMVPLIDNTFNRCKSNINAIEAYFSGAVPLVPDWPEWNVPGAVKYKNPAEFGALLDALIRGDYKLEQRVAEGWNWVWENRLSVTNIKRAEILKNI
jgi:hypothetical protein